MQELAAEIVRLQTELDREIERRHRELGWSITGRLVHFEEGIVALQYRLFRVGIRAFMRKAPFATVLTAPVVYSMIVPLALLDLWATLYQAICFRAYADLWGERAILSVANLTRADGSEFLALAAKYAIETHVTPLPLEQANKALDLLRSGKVEGALVLHP